MGRRGRSKFGALGNTFFITTATVNFYPIFGYNDVYYDILIHSLKHVIKEHCTTLFAYVLMPSHVHLVVYMPEGEDISDFMRDFKKFTSTKVRQQLEKDRQMEWIERLRFNARGKNRQVFKLWMDRFDDLVIVSEKTLKQKIEYIHNNPVHAGLVEEPEHWKYSSACNYILSDQSIIEVSINGCVWQV
jgi:REP-associated tyrosine transposase